MSEKLRFFDPQLKEKPEQELFNEPEWLMELRRLDGQIRVRRESEGFGVVFFKIMHLFIYFRDCKYAGFSHKAIFHP